MPRIRTMPALLTLLALAATGASRATRAEDCLVGPNAQSPQGQHWYYRIDRATHRKCWYLGALHAQRAAPHRRSAARADGAPAASDEDTPARDASAATMPAAAAPAQTGIVAAPPDPGFGARALNEPPRPTADAAPDSPAPAPTASVTPEQIGPRTVATTTERVRPPAPAKPAETAQPVAAAAVPAPATAARGALPAALFGVALLLASVGTMLVRARRQMVRVQKAAPASRRPRRTLSDILAQAERGEPDRADAATRFFDRLRDGFDDARSPDEREARHPGTPHFASLMQATNDAPDIAAATLQPAIEEMPPEPIEPAPDVEQTLRQLLAEWERRAA
jgi:hypothetical protein